MSWGRGTLQLEQGRLVEERSPFLESKMDRTDWMKIEAKEVTRLTLRFN